MYYCYCACRFRRGVSVRTPLPHLHDVARISSIQGTGCWPSQAEVKALVDSLSSEAEVYLPTGPNADMYMSYATDTPGVSGCQTCCEARPGGVMLVRHKVCVRTRRKLKCQHC